MGGQGMAKLELTIGKWWGLLEVPARAPAWSASPVLITNVTPLKTGKSLLALEFVQPIHPGGAVERNLTLQVIQHDFDHLVGRYDDAGRRRLAVLCEADFDWMATYCAEHLRRRPVQPAQWFMDGAPLDEPTPQSHFDRVFGATPAQVLSGATRSSFSANDAVLPEQHTVFTVDRTYDALDSWLIVRGVVPSEMEEKWFVYWADGMLTFRRSWTGIVIYEVEAVWRGTQLHLGGAKANRDSAQYGETDDEYDRALLIYIIDVVLLGKDAIFPDKEDDEDVPLKAWSSVGTASL